MGAMTFLQLCQRVAQESGVIPVGPTTTIGQTGKLGKVVNWTAEAYNMIQTEGITDWRWLEDTFNGNCTPSLRTVTGVMLGITDRFGSWIIKPTEEVGMVAAASPLDGVDYWLLYRPWEYFYSNFMVGPPASETGKPIYFTVSPANALLLHPVPNLAYTLKGRYRKSPQDLASSVDPSRNDALPEMPSTYHMAIVWQTLILLGNYDQAFESQPGWQNFLDKLLFQMRNQQMPMLSTGGPLA
jgi:hypothetical protein